MLWSSKRTKDDENDDGELMRNQRSLTSGCGFFYEPSSLVRVPGDDEGIDDGHTHPTGGGRAVRKKETK